MIVLTIGAGGCGDDLPPGILPAQIVSYEPTGSTTGTGGTTGTVTISITDIQPTSATPETTITISGSGFGTNPNLLALVFSVAAVSATQLTTARPQLTPVQFVSPVDTASATRVTAVLPVDVVPGSLQIGLRQTPATTTGGSQTVNLVAVSNAFAYNPTPRITAQLAGSFQPGNTVTLEATGLSPTLSQNRLRYFSGGVEVGNTGVETITFAPGLRSNLTATTPASITNSIGSIVLDVQGRRSASFP